MNRLSVAEYVYEYVRQSLKKLCRELCRELCRITWPSWFSTKLATKFATKLVNTLFVVSVPPYYKQSYSCFFCMFLTTKFAKHREKWLWSKKWGVKMVGRIMMDRIIFHNNPDLSHLSRDCYPDLRFNFSSGLCWARGKIVLIVGSISSRMLDHHYSAKQIILPESFVFFVHFVVN